MNGYMNDINTSNQGSAVLLMEVKAPRGFIAAFGQFCAESQIDIGRLEQCQLDDALYLRAECAWPEQFSGALLFGQPLTDFLSEYEASAEVFDAPRPQRVALVLGACTPLVEDILASIKERRLLPLEVAFVAALDVDIESVANRYGVPFFALPKKDGVGLEAKCTELVKRYRPELLGVIGVDHVFSAAFHARTNAHLFGVQSGFVAAVSGSPRVHFDFAWAREHGARILVGSSFFYSAKVEGHAIIEQAASALGFGISEHELSIKQGQLESRLLIDTLAKISERRVLRTAQRCVLF